MESEVNTFDPLESWLGIPPDQQPPNYYRLLNLDLFELDPEVIDAASERLAHHLQDIANGPHISHAQGLLNEIAAARVCLIDLNARERYDAELKKHLAATGKTGGFVYKHGRKLQSPVQLKPQQVPAGPQISVQTTHATRRAIPGTRPSHRKQNQAPIILIAVSGSIALFVVVAATVAVMMSGILNEDESLASVATSEPENSTRAKLGSVKKERPTVKKTKIGSERSNEQTRKETVPEPSGLASVPRPDFGTVEDLSELELKERPGPISTPTGKETIDFNVVDLKGEQISKAQFKGKVLIVDIWGTWCPPCRREIPSFVKLKEKYADQLEIVGFAFEKGADQKKRVLDFLEQNDVNYHCVLATGGRLNARLPQFQALPTTFFLDKSGNLKEVFTGFRTYEELEAAAIKLMR